MKKYKVIINDLEWVVKFVNSDDELDINEDEPVVCGATWKQDLDICINEELSGQLLKRTIIHELTHAFIWSYGFEAEDFSEETVCNFMESYGDKILGKAEAILDNYNKDNM